jgi:predicted nucleic acid-binding protein
VSGRAFIDTNVLVYADDLDAGPKNVLARALVSEALTDGTGVISTQVLQEFFSTTTRKLRVPAEVARRKVELLATLEVVRIDVDAILSAIDLHRLHSLSFWDALIVQSAANAGCPRVLSEDLQHGQTIAGVRIENPFLGVPHPA